MVDSIIICGPSGVGKTSVANAIISLQPTWSISKSVTTRTPRHIYDDEYHFVTHSIFEQHIANNQLIEYDQFQNNYYGTLHKDITRVTIYNVNIQGLNRLHTGNSIAIILLPPSIQELQKRLYNRPGTTNNLKNRLQVAISEIAAFKPDINTYFLINHDIQQTASIIVNIYMQILTEPTVTAICEGNTQYNYFVQLSNT